VREVEVTMADDFERVRERIRVLFDPSPKNTRRSELADRLPSLKSPQGYRSLDKVIDRLGVFGDGGEYALGDTFPSLVAMYSSLSEEEKQTLNKFYLSWVEQFEASLGEA
jgi:hypothetical protein